MGTLKSKPATPALSPVAFVCEAGILSKCPTVCEWLSVAFYEDGTPRQPSTVTIFAEDGRVKVAFNDRDGARSMYVTGKGLEECLKAVEGKLLGNDAEWREWPRGSARKGK